MTRFLSTGLALSRLPNPLLIEEIDYEAILAARKADLIARLAAAGYDYDVDSLESDPGVKLQEVDAYRETMDLGRLNVKLRALLAAFATGSDLDHIVLRAGIVRQKISTVVGTQTVVTDEPDETLRMRYFASFGAPAAGSDDAYVFNAMTAYPEAQHVLAVGPAEHGIPGQVDIILTAPGGVAVPLNKQLAVIRALNEENVRPLTDVVNVRSATVAPYEVKLEVDILAGPDPATVRAAIIASLQRVTLERYRGGGEVQLHALASAAFENGALAVDVVKPLADIPRNYAVAPWCSSITVTVTEREHD